MHLTLDVRNPPGSQGSDALEQIAMPVLISIALFKLRRFPLNGGPSMTSYQLDPTLPLPPGPIFGPSTQQKHRS